MRTSPWKGWAAFLALAVGWFLIGWFGRGLVMPSVTQEMDLFSQAGEVITEQAYGPLPSPLALTHAAIRGMVSSLGDKYAVYWEPETAARAAVEAKGDDAIVGLRGEMRSGTFVVTGVTPDLPAARAGIQVEDVLLQIDGWQVRPDATYVEVATMLRGPLGSTGHLTYRRGTSTLTADVPRTPARDVITGTIGSDIAYIRLDRFTDRTPAQMRSALQSLLPSAPRGLIWDLRYNGGGRMTATQQVLDYFEDEGMAFYGKTRDGTLVPYPTHSGDLAEKVPLAVLIGPETYSAPETAAASLADRKRAVLIGETTHGKGMFNDTVDLEDGSAIQISVAQSLSPVTRTWYEGKGVPPHIVVKQDPSSSGDSVLRAAEDYLRTH